MSTEELPPRESMEFDVVIVGAGPSGLAAAIRLKQLNADLTIVVVEKGSEVGAHILSGAVIDPVSLDKLVPDWREDAECPLKTQVKDDRFYWATAGGTIRLPNFAMPPLMHNHHCYIGSLGSVCRWLAPKAEALGVEIYPGFAAAEVLYDDKGAVRGIATGDMGIAKDGTHKDSFTRGMELQGKYTLFAEGARGSLSKQLIAKFSLDANSEPQKFGIGLKEVWEIDPAKHLKGLVQHTLGWPLNNSTGGGSFLYHYDDNKVAVGFVVHLNYDDPYLSPFDEFQRFKTHAVPHTALLLHHYQNAAHRTFTSNFNFSTIFAAISSADPVSISVRFTRSGGYTFTISATAAVAAPASTVRVSFDFAFLMPISVA